VVYTIIIIEKVPENYVPRKKLGDAIFYVNNNAFLCYNKEIMAKSKKNTDETLNLDATLFKCRDILRQAHNSGSFFEDATFTDGTYNL
jgi:hypothetical protein